MILTAGDRTGIDVARLLEGALAGLEPVVPWIAALVILVTLLRFPLPGRGPGVFARRDPWRLFKGEARRSVMGRAGGRCEGSLVLLWGRCRRPAKEADHIYPWSRGGATMPSNGQALCRGCNRSKSSTRPAWWYVLGLERRRRSYFPTGTDPRVSGQLRSADRETHALVIARSRSRTR